MAWRLLLVEDNPGDARLIRELLRDELAEGFELALEETLAGGKRLAGTGGLDAILLDLTLPDSAGLATLKEVLPAAGPVPVLVLTGLDDERVGVEAVGLGAQEYLIKGRITGQALVRAIRYAVERRRLEGKLLEVQKLDAVGRLSGGIAHELNNLLQAMLASLQLMRLELVLPPEGDEQVGELEGLVRRAADLTRQLLIFARRSVQHRERLELNEVVSEALRLLRPMLPGEISLDVALHDDPLEVEADRGQLEQLLANLVANARDAMPGGGRLTVAVGRRGQADAVILLTDTGGGMTQEVLQRACEPFFSTRRGSGGIGLGLSVAQGIAAQHGGALALSSQPGIGVTATVTLPLAPPRAAAPPPVAAAVPQPAPGAGERILLVEDEAALRASMHRLLERLGYRVTSIGSAEEAARLPGEPRFDLLVADVSLAGESGVRLAGALRERWPGLSVILTSGHDEQAVRSLHQVPPEIRFLQKPAGLETLSEAIRSALHGAGAAPAT